MADETSSSEIQTESVEFHIGETLIPGQASGPAAPAQTQNPAFATVQTIALPPTGSDGLISWSASEFIAHEKTPGWYGLLAIVTVAVSILVWFITKSIFSVVIIVLFGVLLGVYAARKPRQLQYQLDHAGLSVGTKFFAYTDFLAFSVVPEGAFSSIVFAPLKRLMPPITIFYDPNDESKIVDVLSASLPQQPPRHDALDRFMTRIRF
jgi:hypothetical protein